jgi:hypothetical protein
VPEIERLNRRLTATHDDPFGPALKRRLCFADDRDVEMRDAELSVCAVVRGREGAARAEV